MTTFNTNKSGQIVADLKTFPMINGNEIFEEYKLFLKDRNSPIDLKEYTQEEIDIENLAKKENLRIEYYNLIHNLVNEHVQKNIIDGTEIPQEIILERDRLKQEYKNLIK